MPCTNPSTAQSYVCPVTARRSVIFKDFKGEPDLKLPCKKCPSCKLKASQEWALRCWHESRMHEQNSFITFTYRDSDLPKYQALDHRDFQLFMKRLRRKYPQQNISYFMCAEYGAKTHRPHFHALLFGFFPPDPVYHRTENGNRYYKSQVLDSLWKKGFTDTSHVTYLSAGYVARYAMKKQLPNTALQDRYVYVDDQGNQKTRPFEYIKMSTRPFVGSSWAEKYAHEWAEQGYCRNAYKKEMPIPKQYLKVLKEQWPEQHEYLLQKRREKVNEEDNTPQRLVAKAICVDARLKQQIRPHL